MAQGSPFNLPQTMQEAVALHRQGRLREAEKLYARALKAAPDNFDALHMLGLIKAQANQMGEAHRLMSAALKLNPKAGDAWINLANVLHALKRDGEALDCLDKALALNPGDLHALQNRGSALLSLNRPQDALDCFERVLKQNPRNGEALFNRGVAKARLGQHAAALPDFDAVLASAPGHAEALYNRGTALIELGRSAEALAALERAVTAAPGHVKAWNNRGRALQELNRHKEAADSFARAIALQKDNADAHFNLALELLSLGQWAEGFAEYEWRWKRSGMTDTRRAYRGPLWLGEYPLRDKCILLHAEQGLGDTIQFARYAPLLARNGARVVLEVHPALKNLLSGLDGIVSCHARGEDLPRYDVHCPLGSLPFAFKTDAASIPADIPYLRAADDRLATMAAASASFAGQTRGAQLGGQSPSRQRPQPLDRCAPAGTAAGGRRRFIREYSARFARWRCGVAGASAAPASHRRRTHRHGGHRGANDARRSDHCGRYVGFAFGRRLGAPKLGAAAVRAGLALDAIGRPKPVVPANAAVASTQVRRLAKRDRARRRRIEIFRRRLIA